MTGRPLFWRRPLARKNNRAPDEHRPIKFTRSFTDLPGSVLADLLFNDGLRAFSGAGVLGALVAVAALAPPGK